MVALTSAFTRKASFPMSSANKAAAPRSLEAFNELVMEYQDVRWRSLNAPAFRTLAAPR